MEPLDLLYLVRHGDENEELRWSLRSVAVNLPHRQVWLAGYCPTWVDPAVVRHVPVGWHRDPHRSSTDNLLAAVRHPDIGEHVVLMNDDFFVLRPVSGVPMLHRGPVVDRGDGGTYARGMRQTVQLLARLGHPDPVSYELHIPMVVHTPTMRRLLEAHGDGRIPVLHKRTLYGNVAHCGGVRAEDVKVRAAGDRWDPDGPFLSTNDGVFKRARVGVWLRERFPHPCRYEQETTMAKKTADNADGPVSYRNRVTGRLVELPAADPALETSRRWERVGADAGPAAADGPPAPAAERPSGNASAETWRAYAVAQGMTADEAEALSRDELRDRYPA